MTGAARVSAVILTVAVLSASSSAAQSLGELAKIEQTRRSSVRTATKALTNADLAADPNKADPSVSAEVLPLPSSAPAQAAPTTPAAPSTPKLDETAWRRKAAELRANIARAEQFVESFSDVTHADPREQARTGNLKKKRQAALVRAEDAYRLFQMQADVARIPKEWIQ